MKNSILLVLFLTAGALVAADAPDKTPQLPFHVVEHFFKFPDNYILAEAVGVAVGPQGHILTANRGNHPLIEFNADGSFIRSFGEGAPIIHAPHSVRYDSQGNLWFVDAGNDLVVSFDSDRHVRMALGRRPEPWVWMTHGIERAIPPPANFYQPTDTAVGPDGSLFVTDGYGNSRVVKFSKEGNLVKYWGDRGTRNGQFNTPHSIVIDAKGTLYVADRQNSRVQVFDTEGNFKNVYSIPGLAWSLCITPGPNQVIFVGSVGKVFKLDLSGKILGELGKLGRVSGYFDSIHALACPDEKTLFLANEFSYRFDKVELQ
jgi:DNA-binding beta-propeller fold protein YncE